MLRDSLDLRPNNPRPLMYLLNHYVILPFMPLDEFGLRLLPAFFGVLSVPVFYFVARRLLGTPAALFRAFLLASSGLLVYYSQFARYWTLAFTLSATYPYAIYLGIRPRNLRVLFVAARNPGALSQAMRQLMSLSVEKRRVMGLNGREYAAAHYSLQAMADRWMALYQELLSKRVPAV